jgi:tetratricopeptide (TPR) repeat protein
MNVEQYLSLLQAASSDEERAAITAEMSLSQLPEPTQTIGRQVGLLSWFNEPVIEALLAAQATNDKDGISANNILEVLVALPFVETVHWGYQFHTTTALGWQQKYEQPPFDFVIATHQTAVAGYLVQEENNVAAAIQAVCSLLLSQQYEKAYDQTEKLLLHLASKNDWESLLSLFAEMEATQQKSWVTLPPYPVLFWFATAFAHGELKAYEQAIADYDQAIALNPEYATAYNNRGNAYSDLKQYEQAIADYDQAIALNPEYATAYNNRGNAYSNLKQYEKAEADNVQSMAINPEYASAY